MMSLGAEGVQIGSRFVASEESSAHIAFKNKILEATDVSTFLQLKKLGPVRLLRNKFSEEVAKLEEQGADAGKLQDLLGKGRARKGMFEGDTEEGELEIGQISGLINEIKPAGEIINDLISEFNKAIKELQNFEY
jgi:enoyl-[acyl-carrier protein] reductase II